MSDRVKTSEEQRAELWRAAWIVDGLAFRILDQARWMFADRERLEHYRAELRRAADLVDGVLREGADNE
jgi:hypothetical protein